jgi:hypothetical protein
MEFSYPPPVDQLLTLGGTELGTWPDYSELGITGEHVPALIELLRDPALSWNALEDDGADQTRFWGPLHAVRVLGQLRAEAAAEPLVGLVFHERDDDYLNTDVPRALAMIGQPALRVVIEALPRAARDEDVGLTIVLGDALHKLAEQHPELRDQAVAALAGELQSSGEHSVEANAFLVTSLVDLRAVESASVIQAAFEAGDVDESINGDWEDVQVTLGLLAERTTPRPWYSSPYARESEPDFAPVSSGVPRSAKAAARAKNRRKAEKQSRKRNRKRK